MTDLLTYARQLRAAYCRETSELSELWTPENPSTGQCHVTALLIQQEFGGAVLAATFNGIGHYFNLIEGMTFDATVDQFGFGLGRVNVHLYGIADPPLQVTREKAALLARLAGLTEAAA